MTTRRKTGSSRKKQAAPRKRPTAQTRRAAPRKRAAARAALKPAVSKRASRTASRHEAAVFPAECTIAQADELKRMLARMLNRTSLVTLDLSAVRRLDTAGLQVIASFMRTRHAAGHDTECRGATEPVLATANLLGLGALISPVTDDRLLAQAGARA